MKINANRKALSDAIAEPGIAYWARDAYQSNDKLEGGWTLTVIEHSVDNATAVHIVTLEKLERGLQVIADKYPRMLPGCFNYSLGDANTGDILIQCAIFGEIKYCR